MNNTKLEIEQFQEKLIKPLEEDIRRTLEVTCNFRGEENHGSNFIGNVSVLIGIETLSQFISEISEKEKEAQMKTANNVLEKFRDEDRDLLQPKIKNENLPTKFMKRYFDQVFQKKEFGVPIFQLIWAFRNSHAHSFYPYWSKTFNELKITGAVDWLYKDNSKEGIRIYEIEEDFGKYAKKLYSIEGQCFRICPQILFVYFKKANQKFVNELNADSKLLSIFLKKYNELSENYGFTCNHKLEE